MMPDYTFVAVPNGGTNSVSLESNQTASKHDGGQKVARRSQLIKDFKAGQQRQKGDSSLLDATDKDVVDIDIEGKDVALGVGGGKRYGVSADDRMSDIVVDDDEHDHVANA